jgi:signal transduction histidine kinase
MANVVRHYRSLAFFERGTELRFAATDPNETAESAAELADMSRVAARSPSGTRGLRGPIAAKDGRRILLYALSVADGTVVIAVDTGRFLHSALRTIPEGNIIVTDPAGGQWTATGDPARKQDHPWTGQDGLAWLDEDVATGFGLPRDMAVAAWQTTASKEFGSWHILLIASAAALHAREQTLVRQVVMTVVGLMAAVGLVGFFIVRQQRYSAALAERLRTAETLQSLERQLTRAEKLATTGVLAAGIAHEVGTPLGIIRARAEILLDRLDNQETRGALEAIVHQIDRISSTIRQVLDFSRSQPVDVRPVDPASAIRSVVGLLEHRFRQDDLSVRVDVDPELPSIAADPNQFEQVMINVLLNACDACSRGGTIEVSARLDAERGADRMRLEIRDDGAGIPAEHLLAVFDPFFTTKKRGEGTGLGLPVAASIVRNHGGEIGLASVPGEGTAVSILWPLSKESPRVEG